MKNKIIILALLLITIQQVSHAQMVQKGVGFMQLGYGFPSIPRFMGSILNFAASSNDASFSQSFSYKGFGPIHFRGEYLLGNRVGLGLSSNLELGSFKYQYTYKDLDETLVSGASKLDYSSWNALIRTNYHFLKRSEKVDLYYGIGLGYAHTRASLQESLEGDVLDEIDQAYIDGFNTYLNDAFKLIPIAIESVFGGRIALGNNAGFYFEVGYVKALAQLGFYARLGGKDGYYGNKWMR
ncbi:MAG: hypothetical protein R2831_04085 [Chitinophagaceae bacterium]